MKMLKARKYTNIEKDEEDEDKIIIKANDKHGKNVMVIILENSRLNISTVKDCISYFAENDIEIGILLYSSEPTSSAKKTLQNLDSSGRIKISIFPIKNFKYCLTDHKLVFPHQCVKKEESLKLKKKYGVDKFPILLSSDVIARYFNFRPGEIIAITRQDNTVSFRIVK
jgi:DNA-directed RNA polymerase subunit H (RpoH/RPB5)